MIPGLSIDTLLVLHVAISLVAIAAGLVAMPALALGRFLRGWQAAFLATTAATSLTGFLFPFGGVTPAFGFGVTSLIVLAIAGLALPRRSSARWARITYGIAATLALYLNVFVLVVQAFQKLPALQAWAPTQSEPPFAIAQIVVLVVHFAIGWCASRAPRAATEPSVLTAPRA